MSMSRESCAPSRHSTRACVAVALVLAFMVIAPPTTHASTPCPAVIDFTADSANASFDYGSTGIVHDRELVGWKLRVGLASCPGSVQGSCGACTIAGLVPNAGGNNQRCVADTSTICKIDGDCSPRCSGGANNNGVCSGASACPGGACRPDVCRFFAGPPMPVSAGGVSVCFASQVTSGVTGTIDPDTGSVAANLPLTQSIYGGVRNDRPCPQCVGDPTPNDGVRGGTCRSGFRDTLACDANATAATEAFGTTSFDCPPSTSVFGSILLSSAPIQLGTGPKARALSAASPNCAAPGHTVEKCLCDTCNSQPTQPPCASNADCPTPTNCVGGANGGGFCTVASECPGGSCTTGSIVAICGGPRCIAGPRPGVPCTTPSGPPSVQCGLCTGGVNDRGACAVASACPAGTCSTGICSKGAANGLASAPNQCNGGTLDCTSVGTVCVGGSNDGAACTVGSECPGGTCENKGLCSSGPVDFYCAPTGTWASCATDTECTNAGVRSCVGGTRAGHACFLTCVGGANAGQNCSTSGECASSNCTGAPAAPTDCPAGSCNLETCSGSTQRACFVDDGTIGNSVTIDGGAGARVGNTSQSSLGALFCMPPTSSAAANNAAGFPGLGRISLPGTMLYAEKLVAQVAGGGASVTTDTEGPGGTPDGATTSQPVETSITTSTAAAPGEVKIVETYPVGSAPPGFTFLGRLVQVTAPDGDATHPLTLVFNIDASAAPGQTPSTVQIFKNGVGPIGGCTQVPPSAISPNPCVFSRTTAFGDDIQIGVYSVTASDWTQAVAGTPGPTLTATPTFTPATTPTPTFTPATTPTPTVTVTPTPTPTVTVTPTPAALDHFTCYKAGATKGFPKFGGIPNPPGVSLVDQFGSSTVEVKKPKFLCAPTNKNGEDASAPTHPEHFVGFSIKNAVPTVFPTNLTVVDQFNPGGLLVDAKKQSHLLVPSAKSLSLTPPTPAVFATDHFECYKVVVTKGTTKFVAVNANLQDQFGGMNVVVKKPKYLCTPVDKNGEAPSAPTHVPHLMCYQVKQVDVVPFAKITSLFVNNQFGPETLDAKKPSDLCVPALKTP